MVCDWLFCGVWIWWWGVVGAGVLGHRLFSFVAVVFFCGVVCCVLWGWLWGWLRGAVWGFLCFVVGYDRCCSRGWVLLVLSLVV